MSSRVKVAYQGEPGAFSEEAISSHWSGAATATPMGTFRDVARAVAAGTVHFGMLPVENSIAGPVAEAHAALAELRENGNARSGSAELVILDEVRVPIRQCLLGVPGSALATVHRVESHPVALAQCGRFLRRYPHLSIRAVADTAGAAREIARSGDVRRAAIASRAAGRLYGLDVLVGNVHDRGNNTTTFVVLARADAEARW